MPHGVASIVNPPKDEQRSVEYWMRRRDEMRALRSGFDGHWREVGELIWPEADHWFGTVHQPGTRRRHRMYSSAGARALQKFAAAKSSLLIPRTKLWHTLRSNDEELNKLPEVQLFFQELTRSLFARRQSPRANFYGVTHEGFLASGAWGNSCMFIDGIPGGGIRFLSYHIANIYIALNFYGQVDSIINEFRLSAKQAHQKWGHLWRDNIPSSIKHNLEERPYMLMDFLHVVAPRNNVDPDRLGPERLPWISIYIGVQDRQILQESGYRSMPYVYSRELVNVGEVYGRGPAMFVLPELQTINMMKRTHLQAGERVAAPPIMLTDDGFGGGARRVSLLANALNFGALDDQGRPLMVPFQTGARLDITREMQQDELDAINDAFGVNLFQILVDDPRSGTTATEILQRAQERGDLLAPGVNRAQAEQFGPMIERELNLLEEQGGMPPLPPVLIEASSGYEVTYVNPAAQLQRSSELSAIEETLVTLTPFAQNAPEVFEIFDPEKVARLSMDIRGGDQRVLRTPQELEQMRQARVQQQQQAQQQAAIPEMAGALKDGAQGIAALQGGGGGGGAAP